MRLYGPGLCGGTQSRCTHPHENEVRWVEHKLSRMGDTVSHAYYRHAAEVQGRDARAFLGCQVHTGSREQCVSLPVCDIAKIVVVVVCVAKLLTHCPRCIQLCAQMHDPSTGRSCGRGRGRAPKGRRAHKNTWAVATSLSFSTVHVQGRKKSWPTLLTL